MTGLRPLRVTLLLALLLAAEAELRRAWPAVAEPGLAVAAEEELRTAELLRVPAAFPFWVVLRRTWSDWVAEELRVAEEEELRVADELRVAEEPDVFPFWVVLRRTWLDGVEEELRVAEEEVPELRVTELEELRVAEPEELRVAEELRFTWLALERCGAAEDRTALEELRVAELEELLRTAEDLLLDEELPEVVVVLRPVEADPLLRRV